ncbi:DUF4188 domain-containing protein [Deinococcus detaillensis]|uniref:DUF4188 domain-containing protein n=1 Tax=Deinococcus detaillensis TaxID=2592048 RepID=A0A553V5V5_9DEIO|nr:DUF4188 domain-containing protein [Deinococcus detaillensis]TSA87848.1 DUF4188 domain-containing protein [Deinococcus detaillensis]
MTPSSATNVLGTQTVHARAKPAPSRLTAELDGDFVVFMIGMRINKPWKVSAWLPVFLAMPRMLAELEKAPELGLLGGRFAGTTLIQFWRSSEHLNAYAESRQHVHLPAWRAFNQSARTSGSAVGIWHETYRVAAGEYETVYVDMPAFGLGQAGKLVAASGRRATAAGRMGGEIKGA